MISLRRLVCIWFTVSVYTIEAFSHPLCISHRVVSSPLSASQAFIMTNVIHLRCGQQESIKSISTSDKWNKKDITHDASEKAERLPLFQSSMTMFAIIPQLQSLGKSYARSLQQYPIRTKSITAGCIFAMSAVLAQLLEKDSTDATQRRGILWSRVFSSALVGFLYFGPAAHYWYEWIFRILPATSLSSTLQKAFLGQMLFGPSFTCIFFATSLLQNGTFTVPNWFQKIRTDLPAAWLAGAGFWPIVDLVSYSFIAPQWIPLFINICSLFWTTYLVLKSYS